MVPNAPVVRRKTLPRWAVVAVVAALLATAFAATHQVTASSAAAAESEPLECIDLVDPASAQDYTDSGLTLIETDGGDSDRFAALGGTSCIWGIPSSDTFFSNGYSRISDAQAVDEQADLEDLGYSSRTVADGTVYEFTDTPSTFEEDFLANTRYLFTPGFWFMAPTEDALREIQVNVTAALVVPVTPTPTATASPVAAPVVAPVGGLGSGAPNAPSTISELTTLQDLDLTPEKAVATTGIALVLVAIVGFPGKLVESALSANYDKIAARFGPLATRVRAAVRPVRSRLDAAPRWAAVTIGLVAAALISGFIDPQFGVNPGSLRMMASVAVSLTVESLIGLLVVRAIVRRRAANLSPRIEFKFGSLLVLVVVVLASRVTGFEPGMIFGVILALAYAAVPTPEAERGAAASEAGYLWALGIVSWLAYSVVASIQTTGADVASVFLKETLGGLAIGALSALPILLLPWPGLLGGTLYAWRRWVWVASYGVAMLSFLVVLLPLPSSWAEVEIPLASWVSIYAVYAIAAVIIWAALTFGLARSRKEGDAT